MITFLTRLSAFGEAAKAAGGIMHAAEEEDHGAFGNFMLSLEERYGFGALFLPIIVLIVVVFIVFKVYRGAMLRKYGWNPMGIPALITTACYAIAVLSGITSSSSSGLDDMGQVLALLLIGVPGMIMQTINCFRRTRSIPVMIINIPIMYFVCFLTGYITILAIAMIFFAFFMKSDRYKCPNCGRTVMGAGTCDCGTELVI